MILITGASGNNGTEIVKRLASKDVRVSGRWSEIGSELKRSLLPMFEVVEGDFNCPETLMMALVDVDCAFLLTSSSERAEAQQIAFIDAARQSGVRHIVKLSQFAADANSPVRFLRYLCGSRSSP